MIKLSEQRNKELQKLYQMVEKRKKDQALEELADLFQKWGKPKREKKKAEERILEYHHLCERIKNTDPFVLVADALSDGIVERNELSNELFHSLEVVVRLMKN